MLTKYVDRIRVEHYSPLRVCLGVLLPQPAVIVDVQARRTIDQLVDGRGRARVALLVNLVEQSRPDLLGFGRSARTGCDCLAEVASSVR